MTNPLSVGGKHHLLIILEIEASKIKRTSLLQLHLSSLFLRFFHAISFNHAVNDEEMGRLSDNYCYGQKINFVKMGSKNIEYVELSSAANKSVGSLKSHTFKQSMK